MDGNSRLIKSDLILVETSFSLFRHTILVLCSSFSFRWNNVLKPSILKSSSSWINFASVSTRNKISRSSFFIRSTISSSRFISPLQIFQQPTLRGLLFDTLSDLCLRSTFFTSLSADFAGFDFFVVAAEVGFGSEMIVAVSSFFPSGWPSSLLRFPKVGGFLEKPGVGLVLCSGLVSDCYGDYLHSEIHCLVHLFDHSYFQSELHLS